MPFPLVPDTSMRQQRLLYVDPKGSKLVMYVDTLLGGSSTPKTLSPGRLTDAQRALRTDLLAIPGAQITSVDSGLTYESDGTSWNPVSSNPNSPSTWTYDSLGRIATETSEGITWTYNYSTVNGRLISLTGAGKTRTITYNSYGQPTGEVLS